MTHTSRPPRRRTYRPRCFEPTTPIPLARRSGTASGPAPPASISPSPLWGCPRSSPSISPPRRLLLRRERPPPLPLPAPSVPVPVLRTHRRCLRSARRPVEWWRRRLPPSLMAPTGHALLAIARGCQPPHLLPSQKDFWEAGRVSRAEGTAARASAAVLGLVAMAWVMAEGTARGARGGNGSPRALGMSLMR